MGKPTTYFFRRYFKQARIQAGAHPARAPPKNEKKYNFLVLIFVISMSFPGASLPLVPLQGTDLEQRPPLT